MYLYDGCMEMSHTLSSSGYSIGMFTVNHVNTFPPFFRPDYHIWSSHNHNQHLLLPPAPGVNWSGGHRRPPLFDPDPQQQSGHYYKWAKPGSSQVRAYLGTVDRETAQGSGRRFLLTGPPKVHVYRCDNYTCRTQIK